MPNQNPMKRLSLIMLFVVVSACARKVPVPPPTPTPIPTPAPVVSCSTLTGHSEIVTTIYPDGALSQTGEALHGMPAPDCSKIRSAWDRAIARIEGWLGHPISISIADVWFWRPELFWVSDKPYPLIDLAHGTPTSPVYARGVTSPTTPPLIQYAYEEVIEHEVTHAVVGLLFPARARNPKDVEADPGQSSYYGPPALLLKEITCHGTPDDPFGMLGDRASCSLPYAGPSNPLQTGAPENE